MLLKYSHRGRRCLDDLSRQGGHFDRRFIFSWLRRGPDDLADAGGVSFQESIDSGKVFPKLTNPFEWSPVDPLVPPEKQALPTAVYVLGQNTHGQLGLGDQVSEADYVFNGNLKPQAVKSVKSNLLHSAALTEKNDLSTWGCNMHFQIGHKNESPFSFFPSFVESQPHTVRAGSEIGNTSVIEDYSLGGWSTYVLARHNQSLPTEVYSWGNNTCGQLGLGHLYNLQSASKIPRKSFVPLLDDDEEVRHVSSGLFHAILLTDKGKVYHVGRVDSKLNLRSPSLVSFLPRDVELVSAGSFHSAVVCASSPDTVLVWGELGQKLPDSIKTALVISPYFTVSPGTSKPGPTNIKLPLSDGDRITQILSGDGQILALTLSNRVFSVDASYQLHELTSTLPSAPVKKLALSTTHAGALFHDSNEFHLWSLSDFAPEKTSLKKHFHTLIPSAPAKTFKFADDHLIKDLSLGHHFSVLVAEKKPSATQ